MSVDRVSAAIRDSPKGDFNSLEQRTNPVLRLELERLALTSYRPQFPLHCALELASKGSILQ